MRNNLARTTEILYVARTFTGRKIRARKTPWPWTWGGGGHAARQVSRRISRYVRPGRHGQGGGLRYTAAQLITPDGPLLLPWCCKAERYLRYGFMGMDVQANLVNMAKAQGLYTIVDAAPPPGGVCGGRIRADGVTVTPIRQRRVPG